MRSHLQHRPNFWALIAVAALALAGTACEPAPPPVARPPLTKVNCALYGTVTVNSSIASNVKALITKAKAAGVNFCGGGYRDQAAQIATRKANCGTTYYDIYQKPSGQCSPPTAIPGTSMHEKGLAIDWTNCSTRTANCFLWLSANAATYGLKNLPSEPWHWSTTGH